MRHAIALLVLLGVGLADQAQAHPHRRSVQHNHKVSVADGATYVRTGVSAPSDDNLDAGFSLGFEFTGGRHNQVEFGFSMDYGRRALRDESAIDHFDGIDNYGTRYEVGDAFITNYMPMMLTARYYVPVLSETAVMPYLSGGVGYGLYWTAERDAEAGTIDRSYFGGVAWQAGGGLSLQLSPRVSVVGDLLYVQNTVSRTLREDGNVYRDEWYLSGPTGRVGVRFGI